MYDSSASAADCFLQIMVAAPPRIKTAAAVPIATDEVV